MNLQRNIFDKLFQQASNNAISILIGARQVGKSTLLKELQAKLNQPCRYLNLENPAHLKIFNEGYTSFCKEVTEKVVFIDEFHYYQNMTSVFKAIYDLNPQQKIYASSSSSMEIHKHLKESLAGRKIQNTIYSLSFSEWLLQFHLELPGLNAYIKQELKQRLDDYLALFLQYGSMPGLLHLNSDEEKREYLHNLYQTYISKDIKTFLKEESMLSYNKLIEALIVNNTCQVNMNNLAQLANISSRQVQRQFEVMESTFVLGVLRPFSGNHLKEIIKMPKTYFYDQGLANVILKDFRPLDLRLDKGAILEQFVYWELVKSLDIRYNLNYWRTTDKQEVDFILSRDKTLLPIEVKSSYPPGKIPNGLKAFLNYYPQTANAVILCDHQDDDLVYQNTKIHVLPWYKAYFLKELLR